MAKSPGKKDKSKEREFLENLIEFLSDPNGLSDKEINEYFSEESNLDIEALTKNLTQEIQGLLAQRNRELMKMKAAENRRVFEERRKQLSSNDVLSLDKKGLIEKLTAIMKTPGLELAVYHRNLSSLSDEDLVKIYKELQMLDLDNNKADENDKAAS